MNLGLLIRWALSSVSDIYCYAMYFSADLEKRELDAVSQVRDAVQMVEKAMMEKEQAEIELKQREEEADKLQDAISKLINEAGMKTRQEVGTQVIVERLGTQNDC